MTASIAPSALLDTLVIGAGPAGLAVADTLKRAGLSVQIIEKGSIADHIRQYPNFMRFFSTRDLLEIDGYPLTITEEKPTRQEYLRYLALFARDRELDIVCDTRVTGVERDGEGVFAVTVESPGAEPATIRARSVVAAVGAWEQPRHLGVPGEDLPKVTSKFDEAHRYFGRKVLVVGGRNSAVETALHLWRAGALVSMSYRRESFEGFGLKYWLRPDIENRLKFGEIKGHLGTTVERIDWNSVTLRRLDGSAYEVENDYVILQLGYDPPVKFLRSMGITIASGTNVPAHDGETLETNVPGLFVAGTIVAGNVSGKVFIENSRHHGQMILGALRRAGIAQSID